MDKEKKLKREQKQKDEKVDISSEDSFPASDPPAWTETTAKVGYEPQNEKNK